MLASVREGRTERQTAPRRRRTAPGTRGVSGSQWIDEPVLQRVDDELRRLMYTECVHDVRAMNGDGVGAEIQLRGNLLVREAIADQLQDLELARRQSSIAFTGQRVGLDQRGIDHLFAGGDAFDRGGEIELEGILQDIAACAGLQRLANQRFLRVHAQHDDRGLRMSGENGPCSFEATGSWHRRIHHDDVRLQLCRQADGVLTVAAFADDLNGGVVFEQTPEAAPHQRVIVHEEHGDFVGHAIDVYRAGASAPAGNGTFNRTTVPPPDGVRISIVPLTSSARSRIATRPRPRPRAMSVGKPRPWSSTSSVSARASTCNRTLARSAPEWRATLLSDSCSTRYTWMPIVASIGTAAAARSYVTSIPSCFWTVERYQSTVLSSPSSSRIDGCSVWESPRTLSSAVCAISRISRKSARSSDPSGACLPARPSIDPIAVRIWPNSSCSSREISRSVDSRVAMSRCASSRRSSDSAASCANSRRFE